MAASGFQHLTLDERRSLFRMQEARLGVDSFYLEVQNPRLLRCLVVGSRSRLAASSAHARHLWIKGRRRLLPRPTRRRAAGPPVPEPARTLIRHASHNGPAGAASAALRPEPVVPALRRTARPQARPARPGTAALPRRRCSHQSLLDRLVKMASFRPTPPAVGDQQEPSVFWA